MDNGIKVRHRIKVIGYIILFILALWFIFVIYNFYRVNNHKRPLLCFNYVRDIEDEDEYNLTCKGILYKYREYYNNDSEEMTGREITMFFTDFTRRND